MQPASAGTGRKCFSFSKCFHFSKHFHFSYWGKEFLPAVCFKSRAHCAAFSVYLCFSTHTTENLRSFFTTLPRNAGSLFKSHKNWVLNRPQKIYGPFHDTYHREFAVLFHDTYHRKSRTLCTFVLETCRAPLHSGVSRKAVRCFSLHSRRFCEKICFDYS